MFGQEMSRIEALIAKANGFASKATISTSTGVLAFDLEPLLKQVYPVLAPFRNEALPRKVSKIGGTSLNAKRMLSISPAAGSFGVVEGARGSLMSIVEQDFSASYRTVGQESSVTFEADEGAEGFDNAQAIATTALLNSNLMEEERLVLFGNGGNIMTAGASAQTALGTPTAPVLTNNGGATGTVAAATYYAYVCALTYNGLRFASVANGVPTTITRTNTDGSTQTSNGGSSNLSPASNAITLAAAGSLAMTCKAVAGAVGYAWFVGTSLATAYLAGVTPVNTFTLTAPPAGTQLANTITADRSIDSYVYDGLITQIQQTSSGSYVQSLNGASLSSNGAAGISQFDTALEQMYNTYKLDPEEMWMDAGTLLAANTIVLANGGAPLYRFNIDAKTGAMDVVGGGTVGRYVNPITGRLIMLRVHPWFPQGMVLINSRTLPYTTQNVPVPYRFQARIHDWQEYEWPLVTRTYQRGQYVSAALVNYAPFAYGLLQNVGQAA